MTHRPACAPPCAPPCGLPAWGSYIVAVDTSNRVAWLRAHASTVGMVEHALEELEKGGSVELDDERKATMVTNLLVVLCSHAEPTPVVNTGGVYN